MCIAILPSCGISFQGYIPRTTYLPYTLLQKETIFKHSPGACTKRTWQFLLWKIMRFGKDIPGFLRGVSMCRVGCTWSCHHIDIWKGQCVTLARDILVPQQAIAHFDINLRMHDDVHWNLAHYEVLKLYANFESCKHRGLKLKRK